MAAPVESVSVKKQKKASLVLTLSSAGLFIGAGMASYWLLTQGYPMSRDLPAGANLIPQDALFAVSLTTDSTQWQKLREFGTKQTQAELEKNVVQLRDRILTHYGYDFQKDISPWVGDQVTLAMLAPKVSKSVSKPVATDGGVNNSDQSFEIVLPIKNPEKARSLLAQPKAFKKGKWIDRTYKNIDIKEAQQSGEKLSAAILDERFVVITDRTKTIERAIDAYREKISLATTPGFAENMPKIATYQPFAQFYVNVPFSAKIAAASPLHQLPAQVLTLLQSNQGCSGTITLASSGISLKGVSWLNPNSQRVLAIENKAGKMQNRLPIETLVMLSGSNLRRFWADYVLTFQGNPLSPIPPQELRENVKSYINLDLDQDLLSWMSGEYAISVIPTSSKQGTPPENFRVALMFMVHASDRVRAEASLKKLDDVMKTQYQFQIEQGKLEGEPVVNWIAPLGTLTATHGWLDGDVAFLSLGAPVTSKIIPKPSKTLASNTLFQQSVPFELNPVNGQFFLDVDRADKNLLLPQMFPAQETLLEAIRSIGVTTAVSDSRSTRYDIFLELKKTS
ncbi:MAG: DUF3352 domain-containing protein [Rhizonema sp. PD37]|nr:DUF3352 domain-containing protein [Rhizonema sp. PD37]